jgi:hypothetical protein
LIKFRIDDQRYGNALIYQRVEVVDDMRLAIERLRDVIADSGSSKAATNAMANLAEAIQGLVQHMRSEQQMIRNWADAQAEQHGEIRRLLQVLARERTDA